MFDCIVGMKEGLGGCDRDYVGWLIGCIPSGGEL